MYIIYLKSQHPDLSLIDHSVIPLYNSIFLILLIILSHLFGLPSHLTPQQHSQSSPFPRAIKRPACSLPQVSHK